MKKFYTIDAILDRQILGLYNKGRFGGLCGCESSADCGEGFVCQYGICSQVDVTTKSGIDQLLEGGKTLVDIINAIKGKGASSGGTLTDAQIQELIRYANEKKQPSVNMNLVAGLGIGAVVLIGAIYMITKPKSVTMNKNPKSKKRGKKSYRR